MATDDLVESTQEFRHPRTGVIIHIPVKIDENNTKVIYWDDVIKCTSKRSLSAKNGDASIQFLVHSNFTYQEPRRIYPVPGSVLDIVESSNVSPVISSLSIRNGLVVSEEYSSSSSPPSSRSSRSSRSSQVVANSAEEYISMYNGVAGGALAQELFENLDNITLEARRHSHIGAVTYETSQRMTATQNEIAQNQKQDMNLIRGIEEMLLERYNHADYKSPRMFIVLPRSEIPGSNVVNPTTNFRLFFLCECGRHTISRVETIMDPVHMANHDGYNIKNSKLFFAAYGSHLLKMMQLIRFGKATKDMRVPKLSEMTTEEQTRIRQQLNFGSEVSMTKLVEYTVRFLQLPENLHDPAIHRESSWIFNNLRKYFEGFKPGDQYHGNLRQIVPSDKYARWVCRIHWMNVTDQSEVRNLENLENSGHQYDKTTGRVQATITNKSGLTSLFSILDHNQAVHDLELNLEDCKNINFIRFNSAIRTVDSTGIVQLSIVGDCLRGNLMNTFNPRRNNPILKLIGGQMIQQLKIKGISDFFNYVTLSSAVRSPQLRVLVIDSPIGCRSKSPAIILARIIEGCPDLARLELTTGEPNILIDNLIESTMKPLNFYSMSIKAYVGQSRSERLGRLELILEFPRGATNDEWIKIHIHSELEFEPAARQISNILAKRGHSVKELSIIDARFLSTGTLIHSFGTWAKTCSRLTKLKLALGTESNESMKDINLALGHLNKLERLSVSIRFTNCHLRLSYFTELLQSYRKKLTGLMMYINDNHWWLDEISKKFAFQGQQDPHFPELRMLKIHCSRALYQNLLTAYSNWIVDLLGHIQDNFHAKLPGLTSVHNSVVKSTNTNTSLDDSLRIILPRSLTISTGLQAKCWEALIRTIDFSCVEYLDFSQSNFTLKEFRRLTNIIPNEKSKLLRIRKIDLRNTQCSRSKDQFEKTLREFQQKSSCRVEW